MIYYGIPISSVFILWELHSSPDKQQSAISIWESDYRESREHKFMNRSQEDCS